MLITQAGKRFHTNRCQYVEKANQEGIKWYQKGPTCATVDMESDEEDVLNADFQAGGVGYFPGDQEVEAGVGN